MDASNPVPNPGSHLPERDITGFQNGYTALPTEEQAVPQNDPSILPIDLEYGASEESTEVLDDQDEEEDEGIADTHRFSILSTTTADPEEVGQVKQYGRQYHKYKEGKYLLPCDETEQDRLDLQHHLWLLTLKQRLYLAPIEDQLRARGGGKVLDMCTGTGIWAMNFADQHEASQVVGKDLSNIQPRYVPPNLKFEIDDLEEDWPSNHSFDYIHGRMLFPCFKDPDRVIKQAVNALEPGGFLEIQDALLWFECDEGSIGAAMADWQRLLHQAAWKSRRDWLCPTKYERYMRNAGLVNMNKVEYKWPINTWPTDKHEKDLGFWSSANLTNGIESMSLALMIKHSGKTKKDVDELLERVKNEIEDEMIHAYIPISVLYGQKPSE